MLIVETPIFTRQMSDMLSDDEYRRLQTVLICNPASGSLIPGSGGLRKLRWSSSGRGKRGGARIIYYWAPLPEQLLMLFMYPKNVADDLTKDQLKRLRELVESEYP